MMPEQLAFTIEVFLNGLMVQVLYAFDALGFELIYKASGIFNYAQGVQALPGRTHMSVTHRRRPGAARW